MRRPFCSYGLVWAFLLSACTIGFGQIEVQVTVNSGTVTTTCVDPADDPDPLWRVNVNNEGWVTYPETGNCFTALPNTQYTETYECEGDIPATLEVCFRAFENDPADPTSCMLDESCSVIICQNFDIPAPGNTNNYTLGLADGLESDGEVNFSVATSLPATGLNDDLCTPIDFGLLPNGGAVGNITESIYSNLCADNLNEPNPADFAGNVSNNSGVWFTFTTDDDPSDLIIIEGVNDPGGTGDEIAIQLAVFTFDTDDCTGNPTFIVSASDGSDEDETLFLECPEANTTYFVLVDGDAFILTNIRGFFGLQVTDVGLPNSGDTPCVSEDIGIVPDGGVLDVPGMRSNFCATSVGDPFANFATNRTVWYQFQPPATGHVLIEAISDAGIPIDLEIGVYRSLNNQCNGLFTHIDSGSDPSSLDFSLEVSCLNPNNPYWIMVDGGNPQAGLFSLSVTDAGDITPVTNLDETICFGDTVIVGSSIYTISGNYADTLSIGGGCDSIVNLALNVLDSIGVSLEVDQPAVGANGTNGMATAEATGGTGGFTYAWCSGETGPSASMLVAGSDCCVTVTDMSGCEVIECFTVPFITPILPTFENDTLDCNGDLNGMITISAIDGFPPYNFSWENEDGTLDGSGVLDSAGAVLDIINLPAGTYTFTITDPFFDTTFAAVVTEPEPIEIQLLNLVDASCFSFCDGSIEVDATGGNGNYTFEWSANAPDTSQLCAGDYSLTVTDDKGCIDTAAYTVAQPIEFIANATLNQAVSCLDGDDGIVSVSTNGNPISYIWNIGFLTDTVEGLEAGFYTVTVTNEDFCMAVAEVEVTEPNIALMVDIIEEKQITCNSGSDGILSAEVTGPGTSFTYDWNIGADTRVIENVNSAFYAVFVENENGCVAADSMYFEQPDALVVQLSFDDIDCTEGPSDGLIQVDTIYGGEPEYLFALNDGQFSGNTIYSGLTAGAYTVFVVDKAGCEKEFDFTLFGAPELTVDLGEDQTIQLGEELDLEAFANSPTVTYTWSPVPTPDSSTVIDSFTLRIQPFESGLYRVNVLDTVTFCTAADDIFVTVERERQIFIPSAFSPNGDGTNDLFYIFGGAGIVEVKTFRVFNRRGVMVFEDSNFQPNDIQNAWDGSFMGQELNSEVFVYVAEIEFADGITEVFKGEIVLIR